MRFMVLVKASKESETGIMPSEKILAEFANTTKTWPMPA
jgi:hypothetical protein